MKYRVGIGFDLHRLIPGNALIIGGISIPHEKSLLGHSDGDVLIHAITDALLGACSLGNIGQIFPDTDPAFKAMASTYFLARASELIRKHGFEIANIDSNILAERPKLSPFFPRMQALISETLTIPVESVSVKAKTMERVGNIGNEEAIAAEAVALVFRND